ncbi:MAG: bifunctional phosphoribosyl-AMP cyclohydrolase/phosphoribosyl-ATP diphosphatase HisIE [Cyclobacteriaceae bacterium]|jgi:phosphoribosyl-ATP pyrophosphohydrolase/phosphoribosyl-AMP cyclohydrolase|nr:bifunctional phosphoribosyl-AMP cyclohydrolase/phosphoribosyl-ATP diphosphatase [Cytophagales bacterium]HNP78170.1 bifunctional phosphoribosyl-AMP cyclohydrolase/phosphoribosyl-ATP diphosphatase HisIE [Cyclobacteriaceae bacterium]HQQ82935.1 bifunctional phosphoribosyl-AMP cyclohydrolase/phosphoribosyl-ATP diphosphatase HisIE [Cyclobacteriaceae bacterium]
MELNFNKMNGLLPCVVQDAQTEKVLMLGFMNKEAYQKTIDEKRVTFFSRSRERLWTKGETSGNYLEVVTMIPDCDRDTLLIKAKPRGIVCHTGADTCFQEKNQKAGLGFLEAVIDERKRNPKSGSYTNHLFHHGINKIAQKVGEEAVELVIEAKDNDRTRFLNEAADLMYHYLVLLSAKGYTTADVEQVLRERHTD